jgi:hypothetical protein
MASKCMDSGTQILRPVTNGTAWCGNCGQTVRAITTPVGPRGGNQTIAVYASHNA